MLTLLLTFFHNQSKSRKTKSTENRMVSVLFGGGDEGDRTLDLLNAIQTRSQLRYAPIFTGILYYRPQMIARGILSKVIKLLLICEKA